MNKSNIFVGPYVGTVKSTRVNGSTLNLDCYYFDNTQEGKWYAEVRLKGGSFGYIWVQNTHLGSAGECYIVNIAYEYIGAGNYCDLLNYP